MPKRINFVLFLVVAVLLFLISITSQLNNAFAQATNGVFARVSLGAGGVQGNDDLYNSTGISSDGLKICFVSKASNLVSDDTNGAADVFVYDRTTETPTRVSVDSDENQANAQSFTCWISGNGQFVAFLSDASNLVSGDTNGINDYFVRDIVNGTTERVSLDSNENQQTGVGIANPLNLPTEHYITLSDDGRYAAFLSSAANLVANDTNGFADMFVRDRQNGTTERISVDSNENQANGASDFTPVISGNGQFVAFFNRGTNLVSGDSNGYIDAFVRDIVNGTTERVSIATDGTQGDKEAFDGLSISYDGRFVVFHSTSYTLVSGDTNNKPDVFMRDRQNGITTRVSLTSTGAQPNDECTFPSISDNGRFVAMACGATNMVSGDTQGFWDIFVRDTVDNTTTWISKRTDGTQQQGFGSRTEAQFNGDATLVVFYSPATTLVSNDTNGKSDAFLAVYNSDVPTPTPTPTNTPTATPIPDTTAPAQISDLSVEPGTTAGSVILKWTAVGDDGNTGTATETDIRYSTSPITNEAEWVAATQATNEGQPLPVGQLSSFSEVPALTGQIRYFAAKVRDEANNWSPISNVPSLLDSGFRPQADGYQFENKNWSKGDLTWSGMKALFGESAVEANSFAAALWQSGFNDSLDKGRCFGMATSSLDWYVQPGGPNVYSELTQELERYNVAFYQVAFGVPSLQKQFKARAETYPKDIVEQVEEGLSSAPQANVLMLADAGGGHHSITPYALVRNSLPGEYMVWVYDNNHAYEAGQVDWQRQVKINPTTLAWDYDFTDVIAWSGDGTMKNYANGSINTVPLALLNNRPFTAPWWPNAPIVQLNFSSNKGGNLLVINSFGKRVGFVNGQFVNEFANDTFVPFAQSSGQSLAPIYQLPLTDTYTILVDGQALTQTEAVSVTQFGPGYAAVVQTTLSPLEQNELVIGNDGTTLSYQAGSQSEAPTIGLALEHTNESYLLEVGGVDLAAGQTIEVAVDKVVKELVVNSSQAQGGVYDLTIEKALSTGQETAMFSDVPINEGDTQIVHYGDASQENGVVVDVDHDSNGTIDETIVVGGPPPVLPNANFTATPILGTVPLTVTFTAATTATVSGLEWSFGDGAKEITGLTHNHVYQNAGTFSATLTITTTGGVDTKSKVITVSPKSTTGGSIIYLPIITK